MGLKDTPGNRRRIRTTGISGNSHGDGDFRRAAGRETGKPGDALVLLYHRAPGFTSEPYLGNPCQLRRPIFHCALQSFENLRPSHGSQPGIQRGEPERRYEDPALPQRLKLPVLGRDSGLDLPGVGRELHPRKEPRQFSRLKPLREVRDETIA